MQAEGLDHRAIQLPMATDAPESTPILTAQQNGVIPSKKSPDYKVYPGRFYVLIAFALLAGQQALSWMTFGTIPNEAFQHFGLTDDDVTLLSGTQLISLVPRLLAWVRGCQLIANAQPTSPTTTGVKACP